MKVHGNLILHINHEDADHINKSGKNIAERYGIENASHSMDLPKMVTDGKDIEMNTLQLLPLIEIWLLTCPEESFIISDLFGIIDEIKEMEEMGETSMDIMSVFDVAKTFIKHPQIDRIVMYIIIDLMKVTIAKQMTAVMKALSNGAKTPMTGSN